MPEHYSREAPEDEVAPSIMVDSFNLDRVDLRTAMQTTDKKSIQDANSEQSGSAPQHGQPIAPPSSLPRLPSRRFPLRLRVAIR